MSLQELRERYLAAPQVLDRALSYAKMLPLAEADPFLADLSQRNFDDSARLYAVAKLQASLDVPGATDSMRRVHHLRGKNSKDAAENLLRLLFDRLPTNLSANSSAHDLDALETIFDEIRSLYTELVDAGRRPGSNTLVGAYRGLGLIWNLRGNGAKAVKYLRAAVNVDPADFTAYPDLVAELIRNDLPAEPVVLAALARAPLHATLHVLFGICKGHVRDHPGAIDAYSTALRLDPKCHSAHAMLASEFLDAGDLPAAKENALAAIALYVDSPVQRIGFGDFTTYENLLGSILRAHDDPYNAETWYIRGIRVSERDGADRASLARDWLCIGDMRRMQGGLLACLAAYFKAFVLGGHRDDLLTVSRQSLSIAPSYVVVPNADEVDADLRTVIHARIARSDFVGAHHCLQRVLVAGGDAYAGMQSYFWQSFAAVQAELHDLRLVVSVAVLSIDHPDYRAKAVVLTQVFEDNWPATRVSSRLAVVTAQREAVRASLARAEVSAVLDDLVRDIAQKLCPCGNVLLGGYQCRSKWDPTAYCDARLCSTTCLVEHRMIHARECIACRAPARYKCICNGRYCSSACQTSDWRRHKPECARFVHDYFMDETCEERFNTCICGALFYEDVCDEDSSRCKSCRVALCSPACTAAHSTDSCNARACACCNHRAHFKCVCGTRYCDTLCQENFWLSHKSECGKKLSVH